MHKAPTYLYSDLKIPWVAILPGCIGTEFETGTITARLLRAHCVFHLLLWLPGRTFLAVKFTFTPNDP